LKIIRSENLWIRSAGMWLIGMAILFATWTLSFRTLPEGIAQGKFVVHYVPIKTEAVATTFIRIFVWNLGVGCIPIFVANLVQINGFPLGYALSFYHWALYGVLLGTNSFKIPGPGRFFPSLITLFRGSGIYEITAYTLISSAIYGLYVYYEDLRPGRRSTKIRKWSELRLSKAELAVTSFAVLLLAASNYLEASRIFHS